MEAFLYLESVDSVLFFFLASPVSSQRAPSMTTSSASLSSSQKGGFQAKKVE